MLQLSHVLKLQPSLAFQKRMGHRRKGEGGTNRESSTELYTTKRKTASQWEFALSLGELNLVSVITQSGRWGGRQV